MKIRSTVRHPKPLGDARAPDRTGVLRPPEELKGLTEDYFVQGKKTRHERSIGQAAQTVPRRDYARAPFRTAKSKRPPAYGRLGTASVTRYSHERPRCSRALVETGPRFPET